MLPSEYSRGGEAVQGIAVVRDDRLAETRHRRGGNGRGAGGAIKKLGGCCAKTPPSRKEFIPILGGVEYSCHL